eukprot:SAG11_NODE_1293_length_5284_cov_2.541562_2_plen_239_part_00
MFVCPSLVLWWPFGLPLFLFYKMYSVRHKIMEEDEDTLKEYDFVLGDYKTTHWYWEVVEMMRKLLLSGLIGILQRGTVAQSVLATVIAFYFFSIAYKEQPFRSSGLNKVKVFSECQLCCILLVCTTLQANRAEPDFATEKINADGYGNILTGLTIAILPITLYFLCLNSGAIKDDADEEQAVPEIDGTATRFVNPLGDDEEEAPVEAHDVEAPVEAEKRSNMTDAQRKQARFKQILKK